MRFAPELSAAHEIKAKRKTAGQREDAHESRERDGVCKDLRHVFDQRRWFGLRPFGVLVFISGTERRNIRLADGCKPEG